MRGYLLRLMLPALRMRAGVPPVNTGHVEEQM